MILSYSQGGPFGCDDQAAQVSGEIRATTLGGVEVAYSFEDVEPARAVSIGLDKYSSEDIGFGWRRRWKVEIAGKATYGRSRTETLKRSLERAGVPLDGVQLS